MLSCSRLLTGSIAAISCALLLSAKANDGNLPVRETPRPYTTNGVPHVQVGVEAVPELTAELLRRVEDLPDVDVRDTVVSLPGAKGFWLADELPLKRPEVIVGGREFAHIHPDGSLHASLNPETAKMAIDTGWAIAHQIHFSRHHEGKSAFCQGGRLLPRSWRCELGPLLTPDPLPSLK